MKNLTALLQSGDLKPKERVLLLVQNYVAKDQTGKEILTEADKHAICEGWRPKDNNEVREYNKYNEGWRMMGTVGLDAQTTYLGATNSLLRATGLIAIVKAFKDPGHTLEFYKDFCKKHLEGGGNALELVIKHSGLELDYVVYRYSFESLSKDLKQDILALDPDGKTESQYLDQEESIADLLNGKDTLTVKDKEKFADLIVDTLRNKYADAFEKKGLERKEWYFESFFADIPIIEIVKKWADYSNIAYSKEGAELTTELTEKITEYVAKHEADIGELLRQTILRWLDEGLLEEYIPICISEDKNTCNDIDTKLPHKEVFRHWLAAKAKAKSLLQKLIDKGELKVENRSKKLFGLSETLKILTGESLYNLKGDFTFARDFKKQVDDLEGVGGLIMFVRECSFMKQYAVLLEFLELQKRLSKVYEVDVTYKTRGWMATFKDDIDMLNREILSIEERITQASYEKHCITFLNETFIQDMLIDLEKIRPSKDGQEDGAPVGIVGRYYQGFKDILGDEFLPV